MYFVQKVRSVYRDADTSRRSNAVVVKRIQCRAEYKHVDRMCIQAIQGEECVVMVVKLHSAAEEFAVSYL